jgi:hypothetical protein
MTWRAGLIGTGLIVCAMALWGAAVRARQISELREEQHRLLVSFSQAPEPSRSTQTSAAPAGSTGASVPPELLRLRAEVNQFERRRAELAGVRGENQSLRAQAANSLTNAPAGRALPAGYLRRAQARFVGFDSPEATMQSLLWALEHRDIEKVQQAFVNPERMGFRSNAAPDEFFQNSSGLIGFAVVGRAEKPDGTIELKVQIAPGTDDSVHFERVGGQWRIGPEGL